MRHLWHLRDTVGIAELNNSIYELYVAKAITRVLATRTSDSSSMYESDSGGNCAGIYPDEMFPESHPDQKWIAEKICGDCDLRAVCLGYALVNGVKDGVWGGTTERERRAIRRRHPDINAWAHAKLSVEDSGSHTNLPL